MRDSSNPQTDPAQCCDRTQAGSDGPTGRDAGQKTNSSGLPTVGKMQEGGKNKKSRTGEQLAVSYLGSVGSFAYLAATNNFSSSSAITYSPSHSYKDVFQQVERGACQYGVIPLESSTHGTIVFVYDQLLRCHNNITIVGEIGQIENHCLAGQMNNALNDYDVTEVVSHPHILDCCSDFLDAIDSKRVSINRPMIIRTASVDSTTACIEVVNNTDSNCVKACICSKEAAVVNGLAIISNGIGNDKNAETRYIIIAKKMDDSISVLDPLSLRSHRDAILSSPASHVASSSHRKASIVLALKNIPGSIFKMSSCFALRDIDIIKIESRPASVAIGLQSVPSEARPFTSKHWNLVFYIDYILSDNASTNEALLTNLNEYSLWVIELGTYYSRLRKIESSPREWKNLIDVLATA